jgi:hypothetical protein
VGVLSDIFVARLEEVQLAEGGPTVSKKFPAEDVKGLDQVKLATLGEALTTGGTMSDEGGEAYDALVSEMSEPVYQFSDEEWVFPIPERLKAALARLSDDEMDRLAPAWAGTEEFRLDQMDQTTAMDYLTVLRQVAQRAESDKLPLFLWMSL